MDMFSNTYEKVNIFKDFPKSFGNVLQLLVKSGIIYL